MRQNNPQISILTPSYNHGKYVKYFIESILAQTEQDFELIIVDDNSSDNNVEEIKKISDERIILIQHEYNKGINAGLNSAFAKARGKYIVFAASDDILENNHLEVTSKYLDENPNIDVFYCSLSLIDENNNPINDVPEYFNLKQKNRYELLRKMFMESNCLLSPGMTIKKEAFEKIYPLDLSIIQLQDYTMHIKLLINGEAHLSSKKLVKYRQSTQGTNISTQHCATLIREHLEEEKLMDSFLQMNVETLQNTFGNELNEIGKPIQETVPYFLGRMALKSKKCPKKEWGYKIIMNLINDCNKFDFLHKQYNFDYKQYIGLINHFEALPKDLMDKYDRKVTKYKKLFNKFLVISIVFLFISIILLYLILIK